MTLFLWKNYPKNMAIQKSRLTSLERLGLSLHLVFKVIETLD